ncbi:MAG: type IV secretory system conjugative DNA transfer family protein [Lachnospiraceae bacterium]|nr:type IV secretory system conjugative DNA transfer family protein [Lachnospiraceae bacterium]
MNAEYALNRVLAQGHTLSENTRETGLNNNVLVVGISGCGKTGGYVEPNLLNTGGSIVVADTKGMLYKKYGPAMEARGYRTMCIDFVHPERSAPYNPLDAVACVTYKKPLDFHVYDVVSGRYRSVIDSDEDFLGREVKGYRELDLLAMAALLIPEEADKKEIFWVDAARNVLVSLMAYVIECMPENQRHLGSVAKLYREMSAEISANYKRQDWGGVSFFCALEEKDPESFAVKKYRMYSSSFLTEKTWACIQQFVSNSLTIFDPRENHRLLCRKGLNLAELGREKTALFVNISDMDRSMDTVVNLFYTQLFQVLCRDADAQDDYCLKVPVHIMLDDFASNVFIPDFDKIISVIRSRDISVSVIIQSISQLDGMYESAKASTIINNCDSMLYMGGQDVGTARFFAEKAGKLPETILKLKTDETWLFTRGKDPALVKKIPPYSMEL